jgi:hypothetical protein
MKEHRRPRRNHSPAFKAKVALEGMAEGKTVAEIATNLARVKLLVASSSGYRPAIAVRGRSGHHLRSFWVEGHRVDVRPVARGT